MNKAHTLVDDFDDQRIDRARWIEYGNPGPACERIRETNGRVEIRPRSNQAGTYSGYFSTSQYDLTDSHAHVELVQPLRVAAGADTAFAAEADECNVVFFSIEGGDLKCYQQVAGLYTLLERIPYDPVEHRWLRLRERRGTTSWEVSRDGKAWTAVVRRPSLVDLRAVTLKFQVGSTRSVSSPGVAIFDNFNAVEVRRHPRHANNNDEVNYLDRPFIGSFSKSLKHDDLGDPDPVSYGTLLRALQSGDPADFEEIRLGSANAVQLIDPRAGLQELILPPAPRFDSEQTAHEMGELYWMALARDIPFISYGTDDLIAAAVHSLNHEFPAYGGPGPVTPRNIFRGILPGEQVGPYVSQLLLKGNVDPRKLDGRGRDANEGYICYGAQVIDQRIIPPRLGTDYLTDFDAWLEVQNGEDTRGQDRFGTPGYDPSRRFLYNLRFGATYVHFDQVLNAFYNAAWILMSEPTGNQLEYVIGATGRPLFDPEFRRRTCKPVHLLQVLGEVLGRAMRAVWWQKWSVHRRLRPEEFGGRIHNQILGTRRYPIHSSLPAALQSGGLAPYFGKPFTRFPESWLLPQAYPEGAPAHPGYGSAHAAGAAACATLLKAFFEESAAIENPVEAAVDGFTLRPYSGADAGRMTVGGEIDKLAGNIALFRNAAGVHFRSDATESFPLGEVVALRLLQELSLGLDEDGAFFELTRFDGRKIQISDGKVVPVASEES